ncbi:hypothetical protein IE81DRAFT_348167 [Ceraceosorus guamensis]|uniref:Uncharacterized protein n=1 Tax=Ceraceosorus guamensis TaxID=1522189 RepID=A0A316VVW7_9BASI|nr:hypothetical protein IE81DRAFT_348167 [Ceraceosorus guamensis]PWN41592.1 hypothetical protein IE81DRAFT_348167 [Ceraceosorus guamensis]
MGCCNEYLWDENWFLKRRNTYLSGQKYTKARKQAGLRQDNVRLAKVSRKILRCRLLSQERSCSLVSKVPNVTAHDEDEPLATASGVESAAEARRAMLPSQHADLSSLSGIEQAWGEYKADEENHSNPATAVCSDTCKDWPVTCDNGESLLNSYVNPEKDGLPKRYNTNYANTPCWDASQDSMVIEHSWQNSDLSDSAFADPSGEEPVPVDSSATPSHGREPEVIHGQKFSSEQGDLMEVDA